MAPPMGAQPGFGMVRNHFLKSLYFALTVCTYGWLFYLSFFTQPPAAGPPMMPQSVMMGQPMMRPPFTGPAATGTPGAPVKSIHKNAHANIVTVHMKWKLQ